MANAKLEIDGVSTTLEMDEKTFKTGSRGFHGVGKMLVAGRKYQLNILAIEVGSKPTGMATATKKK